MNIFELKDACRSNLKEYTIQAFELMPGLNDPNILDIGCGTGISSLEILRFTSGNIIAIDSDEVSIKRFKEKIRKLDVGNRISIVCNSVFNVKLKIDYFDVIVAEGILHLIGFKKGLKYLEPFLKKEGYFLIHDEISKHNDKLKIIKSNNFSVLKTIKLSEEIWKNEYIQCLEQRINSVIINKHNSRDNEMFEMLKSEITMYYNKPASFRSIIYILQKIK
ncbi:class I SAM-dependent methyltransferase [candidate division KSB1 bacterium]